MLFRYPHDIQTLARGLIFFGYSIGILGSGIGIIFAQSKNTTQKANLYLEKLVKAEQFSGAVLLAVNNQIVLSQGYGLANRKTRENFLPSTKFHVASISKMFTAITALKLSNQGKLKLTDSLCKYLKPCAKQWKLITISQLIHHSSGIADYEKPLGLHSQTYLNFMTRENATQTILEQAYKAPLEFKPGTKFSYSNTAYIVLSKLIEQVGRQPFTQIVQDTILKPVKLRSTLMLEPSSNRNTIAVGYTKNWQRVPPLALTPPAGDAALVSTLKDLYQWSQVLDTLPEASTIFTAKLGSYGFGWFIDQRFGQKRYVHTGELPGYRTVFIKYPAARASLIILCNQDQAPMERIARELSQMLVGN